MSRKLKVLLVHQGLWEMEKLSMPLALGYLKAMALADDAIRRAFDIEIATYGGGATVCEMASEMIVDAPDILGSSLFGWNYNSLGQLSETFRQINPAGCCIWGGPHVAHQASRVFRMYPSVDVIVNGEGERPFVNLLRAYAGGASMRDLASINGISYRREDGSTATTADEPRLKNLDEIPSPFLTGAIPLLDRHGQFPYDVALMETNRGCPYKCAFCYWGSATGQKVSKFSRERIREELALFGRLGVEHIVLCDANFGMLPGDRDFIDDFLQTRTDFGFPRNLVCSWAKNKSKVFYEIVERMHRTQLAGDFTLALQTLSPEALKGANRTNMKLNEFESLVTWLNEQNLPCYAELIWGLPGETYRSFLDGYDRVARYTTRIATYTNLLLPNTEYDERREQHGFVTARGQDSDFEYILSHCTMPLQDNVKMHHFLFWSRTLGEHLFLRHIWTPLRLFAKVSQSAALLGFDAWLQQQTGPVVEGLLACKREVVENLDASRIGRGLRYLYCEPEIHHLFTNWWEEGVLPTIDPALRALFRDLFAYDLATQPIHAHLAAARKYERTEVFGEEYYVRHGVRQAYDFETLLRHLNHGDDSDLPGLLERTRFHQPGYSTLYHKVGFENVIDNHEVVLLYVGYTLTDLQNQVNARARGMQPVVATAGSPQPGSLTSALLADPTLERLQLVGLHRQTAGRY